MTDEKTTRRDLLRPLHLLGLALAAGVFAALVTMVSTGAFTERVNQSIAQGNYDGLPPVTLGLVVGGIAFIVTALVLALLILAVDPAEITRPVDHPVLYGKEHDESVPPESPDASTGAAGTEPRA